MLLVAFGGRLDTGQYNAMVLRYRRYDDLLTTKIESPWAAQQISPILNSLLATPRSVKLCIDPVAMDPMLPRIVTVFGDAGDMGSSSLSMMMVASRASTSVSGMVADGRSCGR